MTHFFDVGFANEFGLHESLFISNIRYWIIHNKANNVNFIEGRTWTYNSTQAFQRIFPYLTLKQIRNAIQNLIDKEVIVKGNFNKNPYVHTCWYAFADEARFLGDFEYKGDEKTAETQAEPICPIGQIDLPNRANRAAPEGNSITDNKHINKTKMERRGKNTLPTPVLEKEKKEENMLCPAPPDAFSFDTREQQFYQDIIDFKNAKPKKYPSPFYQRFFEYWTQPNSTRTKMKFEQEQFFGLKHRLDSFWKMCTQAERSEYWTKHYELQENKEPLPHEIQLRCFN